MDAKRTNLWLVVDDDENDYFFVRRAFRALPRRPPLIWFSDGIQAQSYLSENDYWVSAIVSDLNMPQMNGLELLRWVRDQEALRTIPFFVLSSSLLVQEVQLAFKLGAADYKLKPNQPEKLAIIIREWVDYYDRIHNGR